MIRKLLNWLLVIILLPGLTGCSMDMFDKNGIVSVSIQADNTTLDIDEAGQKIITITAKGTTKKGDKVDPDMVWEYDKNVFTALGTPTSTLRLELNTAQAGPDNDITGRTVVKGYERSNTSAFAEVVINITGDLQSLWFEDENGNKISSVQLPQKQTVRYSIGTYPRAAEGFDLIGSTEDSSIAQIEVDSDARTMTLRTGIPGQTNVIIDTERGGFETPLTVIVNDMVLPDTTPSRIVIENGSFISMEPGDEEMKINAVVYDQYSQIIENMAINWESSDPETVSLRGVGNSVYISPRKVGSARITASLVDQPELYAVCDVSVGSAVADIIISPYEPSRIMMMAARNLPQEDAQLTASMPIGKQQYYIAEYLPSDTEDTGVRWSVDNTDVIEITGSNDDEIVAITAKGSGTANLIATSTANSRVASYVTLSVYDPAVEPDLSIKQIKIDPISLELEEGSTETITATAIYQDGSEETVDVLWSTNGSSCEIIDTSSDSSEVEIRGTAPGLTTITATALANPLVSSSATVLVYAAGTQPGTELRALAASPSSITLLPGSTMTIDLSYLPSKAQKGIEKPVVSTDSVSVTRYDESEVDIRADKAGNATITITSSADPTVSARVSVRVLSEEEARQISYLSLDNNAFSLKIGEAKNVKATAHLVDGTKVEDLPVSWTIEEGDGYVSVNGSGASTTITAKAKGEAIIKAALESNPEISARCLVSVYEDSQEPGGGQPLTRLLADTDSITLIEGAETRIGVRYMPLGTDDTGLVWTQTNGSIVYLNGDDEGADIEAIERGTTVIKATSTVNPSISTSIRVNVITEEESYLPSYIILSDSTLAMRPGGSSSLTARIFNIIDQELYDSVVEWSIEDGSDVVSITPYDNDVTIKAEKEGFATIKAVMSEYPDIEARCEIKVSEDTSDPSVYLQAIIPSTRTLTLIEGESEEISISYLPSNTFQKGVEWSSGSNNVQVEGNDEGAVVTGKAASSETVRITITSTVNPEISSEVSVRVISEEEAARLVDSMEFTTSLIEIEPPYPSTEIPIAVQSFDSSNNVVQDSYRWTLQQTEDVISLREGTNGQAYISIRNSGEATIKAQSVSNPNISASCRVMVSGSLESISISPSTLELYTNGKAVLRADYMPSDTVEKDVTWEEYTEDGIQHVQITPSLSNSSVATIKGIAAGTTEVRAISRIDNKIYGTAEIEVLAQSVPDDTMPQSISISPSTVTIVPPFETQVIEATVFGTNGAIYPVGVTWTIENGETVDSEDPIATLSPTGDFGVRITPLMAGEATITATSKVDETITASIPLIIQGAIADIEFINLPDEGSQLLEVVVGTVDQVQVKLSAADGGSTVETDIEWYEDGFIPVYDDDGKIAGYDTDGDGTADAEQDEMHVSLSPTQSGGIYGCSIKAVKEGTITLVVRSKKRPEVFAKLTVNIVPQQLITGTISISPDEIMIAPDDDRMLITATIKTDEPYTFPSDTEIDMNVDKAGLLEFSSPLWSQDGTVFTQYVSPGTQPGDGYLTVSLPDYPGIKAARGRVSLGGELTGFKPYNPEGDDDVLIIQKGDVVAIGVEYVPSNTAEKGVRWSSSDTNIVTVASSDESTRAIVSAVGVGTTTIVAESIEHPGIEGVRYVFTVTVKPVVEAVTFSYRNPDTGSTTTGLTFTVNNDDPIELTCNVFPEILDDTTQLIVTPHNEITGSDQSVPSMKLINGTLNDYIFTPAEGVIGSYQYDILQQGEGLTGEVIDVLTINVQTDSTGFAINDSGQLFTYDGNPSPYVFNKDNPATEITAYIYDAQLQPLANVEWTSSNINVVRIIDNKDNTVTIQMRYPSNRDRCAGHATITATLGNGDTEVVYSFDVYVGVEMPDTLWEALSTISPFKDNPVFMQQKVFYPEMAKGVKTLNFSNFKSSSGKGLELNDGTYCYLNSDLFPDLEVLNISNCKLSSATLSLNGCRELTTLIAEQPVSGDIDTFRISELKSLPSTLREANLDNNLLSSSSAFSGTSLETLSVENNQFQTFRDSTFQDSLRTLKLSNNNNLESVSISKGVTVEINNCQKLTDLEVNAPFLQRLTAYDCALTNVEIDKNCTSLTYLDIHNNNLGGGKLVVGDMSYNNHSFTNADWKSGTNLETFIAYNCDIGGKTNYKDKTFTYRIGSVIPNDSKFIYYDVYSDYVSMGTARVSFSYTGVNGNYSRSDSNSTGIFDYDGSVGISGTIYWNKSGQTNASSNCEVNTEVKVVASSTKNTRNNITVYPFG